MSASWRSRAGAAPPGPAGRPTTSSQLVGRWPSSGASRAVCATRRSRRAVRAFSGLRGAARCGSHTRSAGRRRPRLTLPARERTVGQLPVPASRRRLRCQSRVSEREPAQGPTRSGQASRRALLRGPCDAARTRSDRHSQRQGPESAADARLSHSAALRCQSHGFERGPAPGRLAGRRDGSLRDPPADPALARQDARDRAGACGTGSPAPPSSGRRHGSVSRLPRTLALR
jgi:hypothetical protein